MLFLLQKELVARGKKMSSSLLGRRVGLPRLGRREVDDFTRRTAIASTLLASLEFTRQGKMDLKQPKPFGPIFVRKAERKPS